MRAVALCSYPYEQRPEPSYDTTLPSLPPCYPQPRGSLRDLPLELDGYLSERGGIFLRVLRDISEGQRGISVGRLRDGNAPPEGYQSAPLGRRAEEAKGQLGAPQG